MSMSDRDEKVNKYEVFASFETTKSLGETGKEPKYSCKTNIGMKQNLLGAAVKYCFVGTYMNNQGKYKNIVGNYKKL